MRSARDVDLRVDLWAVGAILFELLTGRQAFDGETLPEVCGAVMSANPPRATQLRPEVPDGLSNVVMRCLEKDPAQRFQSILDLAIALVPFGSSNAEFSLERIERVVARRGGNSYISLNPPLTSSRPSGVRTTPSGDRRRTVPDPPRANGTFTAGALESPVKPRRFPWALALLGVAVLGSSLFLWLRHSSAVTPVGLTSASPAAQHSAAPPASAAPALGVVVPQVTPPPIESASAAREAHAPPRAVPRAPRGTPARAGGTPSARTEPPAPSGKKSPDAAAAWDSASFGPRQ
jgi:serine/threonine protein kinase